jgi:hypothetical protein
MGEPARKLEPEDQGPPRRARADLRLVAGRPEIDEAEAWVIDAIIACYCTQRCQD